MGNGMVLGPHNMSVDAVSENVISLSTLFEGAS